MYAQLFDEQYKKLMTNPYFNADGVPYHALETVVVEAPDHGHESTSEAASFYVYLTALKGVLSNDWTDLTKAWNVIDSVFVPSGQDNYAAYNPSKPAEYAPEEPTVSQYPVAIDPSRPVGSDPISSTLMQTYGTRVYSMHWLADPDNMYGFGTLFNTFQRGAMEGVWDTIPQPCVDNLTSGGPDGFLDLFVSQSGSAPAQWKYTLASDADARVIQAMAIASYFGKTPPESLVQNTTKLGDYLTCCLYDKYYIRIGGTSPGYNDDAFHGLLSWYSAWGAPVQPQGWAFRIGCSHCHSGYQNPMSAYAMSQNSSSIMQQRWKTSLQRQLEFIAWLQSAEGAIAGGCTNSVNGQYDPVPAGVTTFHNMSYVANPVYLNPPSNQWVGMNVWLFERVLCYVLVSKDLTIMPVVDKWINWFLKNIKITKKGSVQIPATLEWTGQPDSNWSGGGGLPPANTGLHCRVTAHGEDIGLMASAARSLMIYDKVSPHPAAHDMAKRILTQFAMYKDDAGYSVEEKRADYVHFNDPVYTPPQWVGTMPKGEQINGATFLSLRKHLFVNDAMFQKIDADLKAGKTPVIRIHRFWQQAEVCVTLAFAVLMNFQ